MRWRGALVALSLLGLPTASPARAAYQMLSVGEGRDGQVQIGVRSYFDRLPPVGYVPVEVTIRNPTGRARTWRLGFESRALSGVRSFEEAIAVDGHSQRVVELLVPLDVARVVGPSRLNVTVEGPGLSEPVTGTQHTPTQGGDLPFLALSERLAPWAAGPAKAILEGAKREQGHAVFDPALMPADWRGLAGIDILWITDDELGRIVPGARAALVDWVLHGGRLVVHHADGSAVPWNDLAPFLPEGATDAGPPPCGPPGCEIPVGFGVVVTRGWDGAALDASLPTELLASGPHVVDALASDTSVTGSVAPIELNGGLLFGFVVCFALAVGPLNLGWLARAPRRWRLFVTTPLISLLASALLALLILVQDGVGGTGQRTTMSLLVPALSREILVQEQASRTGVLLRRSFATEPAALLTPIPDDDAGDARFDGRTYALAADRHGGDWFESRAVQAQLLLASRPTRARVEWLNPNDDGPPQILSTIGSRLAVLYFRDPAGRMWTGAGVHPGVPVTLRRSDEDTVEVWTATVGGTPGTGPRAGRNVEYRFSRLSRRTGFFFARVDAPASQALPTLSAIRWTDAAAYLGPVAPAGGS